MSTQESTYKKKIAFTLAEVLITLGIIGVVAAMTLPTLVQNYKKQETITRLKKSYSVINQAFKMAEVDNGPLEDWAEWDDAEVILDKYIIPQIKGAKKYGKAKSNVLALCYEENTKIHNINDETSAQYVWFSGSVIATPFFVNRTASFKLPDGSCIGLNPAFGSNWDRRIMIDINGSKGPNVGGDDLFVFTIVDNQIKPVGYNLDYDSLTGADTAGSCNRKAVNGGGSCAARIMREGWEINY